MADIVERLRFDAIRSEVQFSKGVASNIDEAANEIERLRNLVERARTVFDEISDLGADGATPARLGNIAHAAWIELSSTDGARS